MRRRRWAAHRPGAARCTPPRTPALRAVDAASGRHDNWGWREQLQEALAHGAGRTENPYRIFAMDPP